MPCVPVWQPCFIICAKKGGRVTRDDLYFLLFFIVFLLFFLLFFPFLLTDRLASDLASALLAAVLFCCFVLIASRSAAFRLSALT